MVVGRRVVTSRHEGQKKKTFTTRLKTVLTIYLCIYTLSLFPVSEAQHK